MIIIDEDGIMHDVVPKKVLEQIRDEIEREGAMFPDGEFFVSIDRINEIIDKYKPRESEDKE